MKLNKTFVVLFSVLSLFLYSCSDDDSQNLTVEKEIKYQKISLKEIRNKAGKNKSFSGVLEAIDDFKKKSSANSREADMNDYYVDENNGSYIENDGTQTYTFPVYDLTTQNQNIENMVITIKPNGATETSIVKYDLTVDDLENDVTPEEATPIDISGKVMENPNICMILFCNNSGHGTEGASHIAGENCVNPAFLFYVYVYVGGSGTAGGGSTGGTTGGTGSGTTGGTGGTGTNLPGGTGTGTTGGTGTGTGTTGGGGIITTPVGGTLSQKQVDFLRALGIYGDNFMELDYSASAAILTYINKSTTTTSQVNAVLYFFKNQMNHIWMSEQSGQSQASIFNFLIASNFSGNSVSYLNQMINIAVNNGMSLNFDNTLNTSNSLSLNTVSEIQNYFDSTEGTNEAVISYEQENPNEKIAVAKLDVSTLFDLNIKVKQKMSPYSVTNVTSNISGLIYGIKWEQKDYTVSINGNVATVNVYGNTSVSITHGGIGTFWTKDRHYTLEIDILTGEVFATIIH